MTEQRFYLNCPYSEKDLCKRNGALWDVDKKQWYVPSTLDPEAFRRWWPKGTAEIKKNAHLRVVK